MTPTEQDKELRLEIARKVYPKPTPSEIMIWGTPEAVIDEVYSEAPIVYEFASYITADRKRVALEALMAHSSGNRMKEIDAAAYNILNEYRRNAYGLVKPIGIDASGYQYNHPVLPPNEQNFVNDIRSLILAECKQHELKAQQEEV